MSQEKGNKSDQDEGEEALVEQWFMAIDKKTNEPYYYNQKGDTSTTPPPGFKGPSPEQQRRLATRKTSFFGNQPNIRLEPQSNNPRPGVSGTIQRRGMSVVNWLNPFAPELGIGEKRGTVLRALYGHVARYEDELTVRPGQTLIGIEQVEGGAWWIAELNGKRGHIPANYVEVVERDEEGRPKKDANYGASPSGWYQAQAEEAPKRPPKPAYLAGKQVPRDLRAQIRDEKRTSTGKPLKWLYLCHTWGYAFALFALITGAFTILWYSESSQELGNSTKKQMLGTYHSWTAPVVICMGVVSFVFEYFWGLKRRNGDGLSSIPLRSILYVGLSAPCFTSYATIITGVVGCFTAILNFVMFMNNEEGVGQPQGFIPQVSLTKISTWTWTEIVIMGGFLFVNLFLFGLRYYIVESDRQACLRSSLTEDCLSALAPVAKGFGTSLDFTCALVLIPVLRAALNRISKIEVSPNKTLASVVPLKKSIAFHKVVAYAIFIGSVGHIAFHYANFALAPQASINKFGATALWTGGGITLAFVILFCAAHSSVRRSNYEAFWWSHHVFLIAFPLLLAHGPKVWYFAIVTFPAYAIDRIIRTKRGTHRFYVDYVRFSHPVLRLNFFPERLDQFQFQAGQYLRLIVPHISENESHPFTISSSWGDLERDGYVSVHIRIQSKGSWTYNVMEYFRLLAGASTDEINGKPAPFEKYFAHFDNSGVVQRGKYMGPDGKPLLRIDGPHSAPAQLYSSYQDVMVIGLGIGLTPAAAILSDVTRHKWRKGFSPETLRLYWIVRHSELESFDWFVETLVDISKRVMSDRNAGAITGHNRLSINVYVTSVPSTTQVEKPSVQRSQRNLLRERQRNATGTREAGTMDTDDLGFNMDTLKTLLKNPTVSSQEQRKLQFEKFNEFDEPNRLGDIWIWNGRPVWEQIFQINRDTRLHNVSEIGVTYCGAPAVARAVRDNCNRFSGPECKYTLNQEVF